MADQVIRYIPGSTNSTQYVYVKDTAGNIGTLWTALTPTSPTINGVTVQYAERYNTAFTYDSNTGLTKVSGTPDSTFGSQPGSGSVNPDTTTNITLANGANNNIVAGANFVRITGPSAGYSITGISGGSAGAVKKLYNAVAQNLTIANNSGSSTPGNKILTGTGGDVILNGLGTVYVEYSPIDSAWVLVSISEGASGTGTVTTASVVTANGFAGTVATATTTPAITLTTSITGILKGNGTAISAATAADLPLWVAVPASAGAAGTAGQVARESGFLYVCVATNTWQRVAIATW